MTAPITDRLPIGDIRIGERRREDYGDLGTLADSIERYGLLHPIVIDDNGNLVAGERRLQACQSLGWSEIDVRRLGDLSEAERREIELEENLRRKDLTAYERNKTLVALVETAREVAETCAESTQVSKPARGPSREPGSLRDVAQRIGIPEPTIRQAESHVETVDDYLPTAGPGWKQYHVLEARTHLEKLPESDRQAAARLIDQPGIPARTGCEILGNLATMAEPDRRRVLELAESGDVRDRSLALTTAAERPPMPDPRANLLDDAIAPLRKIVKNFPNDEETPRLVAMIAELRGMAKNIREDSRGS